MYVRLIYFRVARIRVRLRVVSIHIFITWAFPPGKAVICFTSRSHAPDPNARMETGEELFRRPDRAQVDDTHLNNDDEECESGSYDEDGSCTDDEDGSDDEESEEDEPVLKYRRFAKEVVDSLSQGSSHDSPAKNVIVCMAIHTKVSPEKCPFVDAVLVN